MLPLLTNSLGALLGGDVPARSPLPALVRARASSSPGGFAVPFGPSAASSTAFAMDERFRAWPALNDCEVAASVGVGRRSRLDPRLASLESLFEGDALQKRLARALTSRQAVDRKEFFETFEFFTQVRSSLRPSLASSEAGAAVLVDVAGGHGLLALLFAVFEWRRFQRVVVVDTVSSLLRPLGAEL